MKWLMKSQLKPHQYNKERNGFRGVVICRRFFLLNADSNHSPSLNYVLEGGGGGHLSDGRRRGDG